MSSQTQSSPVINQQSIARLEDLLDEVLRHAGLNLAYESLWQPERPVPRLTLTFSGQDVSLLLDHRAELLLALEHLGAKVLGLEPEEHDRLSFDAGGFKAERDRQLALAAGRAIEQVRLSGRPYTFPPMSSRERRLLHIALSDAGLETRSEGEGGRRHLIVSPPAQPRSS